MFQTAVKGKSMLNIPGAENPRLMRAGTGNSRNTSRSCRAERKAFFVRNASKLCRVCTLLHNGYDSFFVPNEAVTVRQR